MDRRRKPVALAFWGTRKHDRAHLTIGDILSAETVYHALQRRGVPTRILFEGNDYPSSAVQLVDPTLVTAADFSAFIFVCGPLHAMGSTQSFFNRFSSIPRIALNVSQVTASADAEKLFDLILWRDRPGYETFDVAISAAKPRKSQRIGGRSGVGVCLVSDQPEYGSAGQRGLQARALVDQALKKIGETPVEISTMLQGASPEDVENAFGGVRLVITTRLHGGLFSIRNATPFVAVDQVAGGAKVWRVIGKALGWPLVRKLDDTNIDLLIGDIRKADGLHQDEINWYHQKAEALAQAARDYMCDAALRFI